MGKAWNWALINYGYSGPFCHHFCTKTDIGFQFATSDCCRKTSHRVDRAIVVLLAAYQDDLVTFKLMTSQVVQRAWPLSTLSVYTSLGVKGSKFC